MHVAGAYVTFVKMIYISLNAKDVTTVVRVLVLAFMFAFDIVWCWFHNANPASFMWFLIVDIVVLWCVSSAFPGSTCVALVSIALVIQVWGLARITTRWAPGQVAQKPCSNTEVEGLAEWLSTV